MTTKYILHGGETSKKSIHNDEFFAEFTNIEKKQINVLLCYWATEREKWGKLFKRDESKIRKQTKIKNLNIEQVIDVKDFNNKIKKADVFYIAGGETDVFEKRISKIKDFKQKIKGKLVIGSSVGAFFLCKYSINSFDSQNQEINKGFGLLPISVLCHFDIEKKKKKKIKALKNKSPELPIITLDECKFAIFYA